ncbi:F0F1 ATP synthase subunit epsilon [Metamycoplasma phocicerebrale]|uniref:ATP synthase epsilon chain n=1 Tax=Metamycoplasma phocicerebrale TaxID=142649 RepID=A0A3T0TUA6_9BACT|nr:F0F1 ATP synthase subunit epsilon [Metamycoplasma phocicerebrale]AZZ65614.1 F0F1 ATP synthase subunit epsilon [Metamycoplasma phocicerebrale]
MSNKNIDVIITTPLGIYYESKASIATFSTTEGQIGLMNGAIPFMAALVPSQIIIKPINETKHKVFFIDRGIAEFKNNLLSLIVNHIDVQPFDLEAKFKQNDQKKYTVIEELVLKKRIAEQNK